MLVTNYMYPTGMTYDISYNLYSACCKWGSSFSVLRDFLHLPLARRACDIFPPHHIYTHHYLTLHSLLLSSFFLPPVYNWILFSGCYKCLCLLCLCFTPHFLSLLHRHPLLSLFPLLSPSLCRCVKPPLSFSFSYVLPTNCFISAKPFITLFILLFVTVKYDGH